jgi:death on curing protein
MAVPVFLTLDEVLALHADQIDRYGGSIGIRDLGLLASAIGMPSSTFGGQFLHETLPEMAAAYLFHIAKNHPFVDGNKRTALATALGFLWMNDFEILATEDELTELVLGRRVRTSRQAGCGYFLQAPRPGRGALTKRCRRARTGGRRTS